jgi:hypothetical protein
MSVRGVFAEWQPVYAAHRIPTFPVTAEKRPATKGYLRTGIRASTLLAQKFAQADALGFACGPRSKLALIDVDSKDERVLAAALSTYGDTPVISRTPSGYHAWYRHNGEHRSIRPLQGARLDILGGGYAVAPPSRVSKGGYEFIQGGLDDLDRLPIMRPPPAPARAAGTSETPAIHLGHRNSALWKHCMRQAHHCDDFDALLDVAHTFNENCLPPLEEAEVVKTAKSAWQYTERGQNRFGQHGAFFPIEEVHAMLHDQDAFFLLAFLRANQGPWATFMCANGLAQTFGWPRVRFASARRRLIELGYLRLVRAATRGAPAMYQWA